MNAFKKTLLVITLLSLCHCFPPQHRLDFDMNQDALISCDERIKIRHLRIMEKNGEGIGFEILLKKGVKGSNVVYLNQENEGYYCNTEYPIKLKPNQEYTISSVWLDSGLEMNVFTNSEGKIDSVDNPFCCLKEN